MPKASVKRTINCSKEDLINLVFNIEDYPKFIPYCLNAKIYEKKYVEKKGFSVVRDFCGHGVGKKFHEHPNILHYGEEKTGDKVKTGMIFTIEPMINEGQYETKVLNDGWTAVTKDKKLSAQFEHTVGITDNGYEIFTTSNKGLDYPPYKI